MLCWNFDATDFDKLLDTLTSCAPRTCGSAPALVSAVTDGAELALHLLGSYALRTVSADPTLHIAPSAKPSLAVSRVAFIPRRAANPHAASAFLAYLLSPERHA